MDKHSRFEQAIRLVLFWLSAVGVIATILVPFWAGEWCGMVVSHFPSKIWIVDKRIFVLIPLVGLAFLRDTKPMWNKILDTIDYQVTRVWHFIFGKHHGFKQV
jgi:hypothetical protein